MKIFSILHSIKKYRAKLFWLLALLITLTFGLTFLADKVVNNSTENYVFNDLEKVPARKVGLVLGTSKYITTGQQNLYYRYRIDAAVRLYQAGKIKYLLLSGDNATTAYNEPATMKADLVKRGVPAANIYLDYAGFRTLDSMVRCRDVFKEDAIITISQKFHNQRAVYIGRKKGLDAIGFNAKDVSTAYGFKTQVREKLARVKMMLDLLFDVQPKFGGPAVLIGEPS